MDISWINGRIGGLNNQIAVKNSAGKSKKARMKTLKRAGVVSGAVFMAACSSSDSPLPQAQYTSQNCTRIALHADGARIVGAEDLDIDRATRTLFISAYDRRAAEKAAKKGARAIPEGGLYKVSIDQLLAQAANSPSGGASNPPPLAVSALVKREEVVGGLRPHGVSFDPITQEVSFINRAYNHAGDKWRMTARIERVGASGEAFMGAATRAPCAANDLVSEHRKTMISFDHGFCDWRKSLETVFSLKRSGVAMNGAVVYGGGLFANGVVRLASSDLALAETRDKSLVILRQNTDGLTVAARHKLPGGPDNLTLSEDGAVIAALHPDLMKMGAHRRLGWAKRAPSRIVKIDPQSGAYQLLFDDREGALFSAATVGLLWRDAFSVGSVTDDGLLVCQKS